MADARAGPAVPRPQAPYIVVSAGGAECRPARAADPHRCVPLTIMCISVAAAMVAVVALAGSEPPCRSAASRGSGTLAERQRQLTQLTRIKIGGTTIGDTGTEAGNLGAFWNTADREPGSTPDSSGAGAFGTWGVESVEPAGEAYADGKKEAEDAFVAARGGAAGDDDEREGRGDAGSASSDADDPWLAGDVDRGGASGDHGGYLGAGKSGSTVTHPDDGLNLDGSRWAYRTQTHPQTLNSILHAHRCTLAQAHLSRCCLSAMSGPQVRQRV